MRLSDYLIRPISTSTEPSRQYEKQLEVYNLAVNLINRMTHPIPAVCDTEKIRTEIYKNSVQMHFDGNFYIKMDEVLKIIDKYMKGESI